MMARDLYLHYRYAGGRVLAFPGFEIYGDTKRQVLSELIMPEQLLELITGDKKQMEAIRKQKIALGIDEVSNFFNHHNWWNIINDILNADMGQRRKLGIAIMMTGPFIEELPPDIRRMIHEEVRCWDEHVFNRAVPRGHRTRFIRMDRRGMFSNPRFPRTQPQWVDMWAWNSHYDTYSPVDPMNRFVKLKIQGREVLVTPDGQRITQNVSQSIDTNKLNGLYLKSQPKADIRVEQVKQVLKYFKDKGAQFVPTETFKELFPGQRLEGQAGIASIIKSLGAVYKVAKRAYDIDMAAV